MSKHPEFENLSGRDLDLFIAEHLLKWKPCKVGKDYNGENECEVLTKSGELPENYSLPPKGKLFRGIFAPCWSSRLDEAISLARSFGETHVRIEDTTYKLPESICKDLLRKHLK